MRLFVTVGSTQFDALVQAVISPTILSTLRSKGYSHLVVQCGRYSSDFGCPAVDGKWTSQEEGLNIEIWRFKSSLAADYELADMVISHAGSGTILDVLRLGKPLIVVPNPTLADDHQQELAFALEKLQYLRASTIPDLRTCINSMGPSSFAPFPPMDPMKFSGLLDEVMGFETSQ